MSAHDLETKILAVLRGLPYAGSPVKARTIVRILCDQFGEGFHRRQINPVLYRMRAEGKVTRDEYFRWSFREDAVQNPQELVRNTYSNRAPSELNSVLQESGSTAPRPKPQTPRPSTEVIPAAPGSITSPRTTAVSESQPKTNFAPVTYGPFTVAEETAGYERYCEWCSAKIGAKMPSVVVRSDGRHKTKFCSEECWQNWESIYWQRTALKRLQLTREAFRREQRLITRQKHFLGYGW
jgi:hypothetical protein